MAAVKKHTSRYSNLDREEARILYVEQGLGTHAISAKLGMSPQTLWNWSNKGNWKEQRYEYWKRQRSFTQNLTEIREAFSVKTMETRDSQDLYALLAVENHILKREAKEEKIDKVSIFTEHIEFIFAWLQKNNPELLKSFGTCFRELAQAYKESVIE